MATGNSARDWQLWEDRYCAVRRRITLLHEQVKAGGPGPVPRQETFDVLLPKFRDFADSQFNFHYHGFNPRAGAGFRLEPSIRYPEDFVLQGILDQVAFDVKVLEGAWYQRVLANHDNATKETLETADKLAYLALLPAIWHKLLPYDDGGTNPLEKELTVLTYFQKAPNIRVVPYAAVALVGIPFTTAAEYDSGRSAAGNARDLLAIPHEMGHYVYGHGLNANGRLQVALQHVLQGKPDWLLTWAEEIFADAYGCFIAGPVMARDFQDLMRDNDVSSLLVDDGEHPMPVLRPLLYCDALKIFAEHVYGKGAAEQSDLWAFAQEADERWMAHLGHRGEEEIGERREVIKAAIEAAFDLLVLVAPSPVSLERLWSVLDSNSSPEAQYNDAYDAFHDDLIDASQDGLFERVKRHAPQAAAGAGEPWPPELDESWKTPLDRMPALNWLREIRDRHRGPKPCAERGEAEAEAESVPDSTGSGSGPGSAGKLIPAEVWTLVASMHGWATNGPESDPDPRIK